MLLYKKKKLRHIAKEIMTENNIIIIFAADEGHFSLQSDFSWSISEGKNDYGEALD